MCSINYTTRQVAEMAGVHKDTLLRWLREGRISEPGRDRNEWRSFTTEEAEVVVGYAKMKKEHPAQLLYLTQGLPFADSITRLSRLNWDFTDATTGYLTHAIHPYPAKFIPQIPNTLIQELSSVGEAVLDPFCGSGTSLVEALRLGRNCVGVDANPLACLISRAKTTRVGESEVTRLQALVEETAHLAEQTKIGMGPLFPDLFEPLPSVSQSVPKAISDWFEPSVIDELAVIKSKCLSLESVSVRDLALTAFSSIIVAVSRQDSDTRYVRRQKNLKPGDAFYRFSRALQIITQRAIEFTDEVDAKWTPKVVVANTLSGPDVGTVDLVVCSPPYPNAYSYHLYHRTRMYWLDMDQPRFKSEEIGSHRKYSRKGPKAATSDTFRGELSTILAWVSRHLGNNRHACFVIGDSVINGKTVRNDELLSEVGESYGFQTEANIRRELQSTKKYFNPAIGKIKYEHIVILRNTRGG